MDRLYGWKTCPNAPIRNAFKMQSKDVMGEFEQRVSQVSEIYSRCRADVSVNLSRCRADAFCFLFVFVSFVLLDKGGLSA